MRSGTRRTGHGLGEANCERIGVSGGRNQCRDRRRHIICDVPPGLGKVVHDYLG
jgi:hypothetical protein